MADTLDLGDRGRRVERLQRAVNRTLDEHEFPWRKIKPDGIFGPKTQSAARFAGWLLGFAPSQLDEIEEGDVTEFAFSRLVGDKPLPDDAKERAKRRKHKARELRFLHNNPPKRPDTPDVVTFDGHPVAAWMAEWLEKSRRNGWRGTVVSGFRDPDHSERLCIDKCGKPSCPGICAGRTSNHGGAKFPEGAVDVSVEFDDQFGAIQRKIGSPLKNDLPNDTNHFSVTGH